MKIRACYAAGISMAGMLAVAHAMVANEVAPLPGLETCINAALQQRPGVLFGWRLLNDVPPPSYRVTVITADGKTADAVCASDNANNLRFENRMSIRRFERYREIAVPESAARKTAPLVFAGNVKITAMEIDTDVKGRLWYEYTMDLPSGHKAMAHVDTTSGFLTSAEAKE